MSRFSSPCPACGYRVFYIGRSTAVYRNGLYWHSSCWSELETTVRANTRRVRHKPIRSLTEFEWKGEHEEGRIAVCDTARTIEEVKPEELARIWTDAEVYQSGEVPASYGWWVTNRFDRADLIQAAELVLRTLKGEEPIITRQVDPSRDEWNKGLPCDGCAESYPCEIHKGEPGSDSWTMRTRRETK